jgi:hypothetical protein
MNLEADVRAETESVLRRKEGFTRTSKSVGSTTCAMSGCTNKLTDKMFVTCVFCRQQRLLAQIAELIPEDVEA